MGHINPLIFSVSYGIWTRVAAGKRAEQLGTMCRRLPPFPATRRHVNSGHDADTTHTHLAARHGKARQVVDLADYIGCGGAQPPRLDSAADLDLSRRPLNKRHSSRSETPVQDQSGSSHGTDFTIDVQWMQVRRSSLHGGCPSAANPLKINHLRHESLSRRSESAKTGYIRKPSVMAPSGPRSRTRSGLCPAGHRWSP
jgi:hypothetical protein